MLFALSGSHKLGLGLVAGAFVVCAALVALVVPRYRPDFPGARNVRSFSVVAFLFFVGMMLAVVFFGRESKEKAQAATGKTTPAATAPATTTAGAPARTVDVTGVEFKFTLSTTKLGPGSYVFAFKNDGKVPHNLTISGPGANNEATPTIGPGTSSQLKVSLASGTYELYCSVPGHKAAGMDLKITVP